MTTRDLLTETYQDLTILAAGEVLSDADAAFGLSKLTRLFDSWNAERAGVYADRFTTYTLTPSLQPHTIGPTGTFVVAQRPVDVPGANLVLTNVTPNVRIPFRMRDAEWWRNVTVQGVSTSIPSDCFYSADWPNGSFYLWPVPTTAYGFEVQTRVVLSALGLNDTLTFPPGYRDALTLTLGEMIAPAYPPATPDHVAAAKSRARIFANNDITPTLVTRDAGMPVSGGGGTRGTFNYRSGLSKP